MSFLTLVVVAVLAKEAVLNEELLGLHQDQALLRRRIHCNVKCTEFETFIVTRWLELTRKSIYWKLKLGIVDTGRSVDRGALDAEPVQSTV